MEIKNIEKKNQLKRDKQKKMRRQLTPGLSGCGKGNGQNRVWDAQWVGKTRWLVWMGNQSRVNSWRFLWLSEVALFTILFFNSVLDISIYRTIHLSSSCMLTGQLWAPNTRGPKYQEECLKTGLSSSCFHGAFWDNSGQYWTIMDDWNGPTSKEFFIDNRREIL